MNSEYVVAGTVTFAASRPTAQDACIQALAPAVAQVAEHVGAVREVTVAPDGLGSWFETFRILQAASIWSNHGQWISATRPAFGPGIKERFEWAEALAAEDAAAAGERCRSIQACITDVVGEGDILCLPTSPRPAPLKNTPVDDIEIRYRHQAMHLLCIASLGGLAQISLPLAEIDGLPLGLSRASKARCPL